MCLYLHGQFLTFCRGVQHFANTSISDFWAFSGKAVNITRTPFLQVFCGGAIAEQARLLLHGQYWTFCRGVLQAVITPFFKFWVFCGGALYYLTIYLHGLQQTFCRGVLQLVTAPIQHSLAFCGGANKNFNTSVHNFATQWSLQTELQQVRCLSLTYLATLQWPGFSTQRWTHGKLLAFCRGALKCITPNFQVFCGGTILQYLRFHFSRFGFRQAFYKLFWTLTNITENRSGALPHFGTCWHYRPLCHTKVGH